MITKLSILVPVFNEVATAETLLRRVAAVRFPIDREIIVVDDGSSDGSTRVLRSLADENLIKLIVHEANQGKGAAVRTALRHTTGDVIVIQDADLELDPEDLPMLLVPILRGESNVCYGSRFQNGVSWNVRRRPSYWANILLNKLSNLVNGIHLTDFNTCYKMMTMEVMSRLSITQSGFAMEPEITAKITRLGYGITERPVHYRPRTLGAGKKIRSIDFLRYLSAIVRYRYLRPGARAAVSEGDTTRAASMPVADLGARPGLKAGRALEIRRNPVR